jgi:hypothetical protein
MNKRNLKNKIKYIFKKKLGMVVHTCHPRYGGKLKIGRLQSRLGWAKTKSLSPK